MSDVLIQVDGPPSASLTVEATELISIATEGSELRIGVEAPPLLMSVDGGEVMVAATGGTELAVGTDPPAELSLEVDASPRLTLGISALANLQSQGGYLPPADLIDESNPPHFYFGWYNVGGSWLIRRQKRNDASAKDATIDNNPGYADLDAAWPDRTSLNYA